MKRKLILLTPVLVITSLFTFLLAISSRGADHLDTPLLQDAGNQAAQFADMYVFRSNPEAALEDQQLVIALTFNPLIPAGTTVVPFDEDVRYIINVDNMSELDSTGNVSQPEEIEARIQIITMFKDGRIIVMAKNMRGGNKIPLTAFFAGLRDDPFIVPPINANEFNVNAIVMQLPLVQLLNGSGTLLLWAQTKTKGFPGKFQESTAKPDTSTVLGNLSPSLNFDDFNQTEPKDQVDEFDNFLSETGGADLLPDVMIFQPGVDDGFPNGRKLEDDVVDIVAEQFPGGLVADDATENNVPFLDDFPFLAGPN